MEIALLTEGTYPYHPGGVSVWCDQLLRALPDYGFHVVSIGATGREPLAWDLPANVRQLDTIALWGSTGRGAAKGKAAEDSLSLVAKFFASLDSTSPAEGFLDSLMELAEFAPSGDLYSAFASSAAVDMLLELNPMASTRFTSIEDLPNLTVADAVEVATLLEHFLRPLSYVVPESDVCHSVANGLGMLPALASKWRRGTPILMTEHGLYLRERYLSYRPGTLSYRARALILRFFRRLVEVAYDHADLIAPGSEYNMLWETVGGAPANRIVPVHNGVDPAEFPSAPAEPSEPTLSWIGRIDPLKDVETLLRSFALVHEQVPECRLRLFGAAPKGNEGYLERCLRLVQELGVEDWVTFEGRVDSAVAAYEAGHVVLLTSISEGLPYTVVEAMACGRPVVATDVGGVAEVVGPCGALVPPRNPPAIAEACIALLNQPQRRRDLGRDARARVVRDFTVAKCFDQYRQLYGGLVRPDPSTASSFEASSGVITAVPVEVSV